MSAARFSLGTCVATLGAIRALSEGGGDWRFNAAPLLVRHQDGDWGDVPPEDARENELSVREGFRIVSSYEMDGERLWIITEADRSSTCILLPEEY
ncbi:MAG: hypothetical protein AVDCRST_MAG22-1664 [uncultured Rubrobacteraceae bacterium]|uniref:FIG146805: Plasmid related protein n=1 Tax=uncultured Rubrobacteraceae bacterium TaxID=349277 RepID=A0A6J4P921_9ACTN|nr:MAG: hypothetical protein AVDCRST_MAG22-1664 [uncultured Rubrobacteraceae bacterium]